MDYDFTYTGAEIQAILDTGKKLKDSGYIFLGVATPSTNPGTPTQKVYYEAKQAGTYTNFGGVVLPDGISLLIWNESWTSETVMSGDGGVFDISVYKSSGGTLATFADLAAALNGGNNIPVGVRKGGMSVKFVQSSDNKYVQYRLTSNTFTTTVSEWQKQGAEVSVSQNTSTGHTDITVGTSTTPVVSVDDLDCILELLNTRIQPTIPTFENGHYINNVGNRSNYNGAYESNPISLNQGDTIIVKANAIATVYGVISIVTESLPYEVVAVGTNVADVYTYIADSDCSVVLSGSIGSIVSVCIVSKSVIYDILADTSINSQNIESIKRAFGLSITELTPTFENGHYINYAGERKNYNRAYESNPISLHYGDTIVIEADIVADAYSVIAKVTESLPYISLVVGENAATTYYYSSYEECSVVLSAPIGSIKRVQIIYGEVFEHILKDGIGLNENILDGTFLQGSYIYSDGLVHTGLTTAKLCPLTHISNAKSIKIGNVIQQYIGFYSSNEITAQSLISVINSSTLVGDAPFVISVPDGAEYVCYAVHKDDSKPYIYINELKTSIYKKCTQLEDEIGYKVGIDALKNADSTIRDYIYSDGLIHHNYNDAVLYDLINVENVSSVRFEGEVINNITYFGLYSTNEVSSDSLVQLISPSQVIDGSLNITIPTTARFLGISAKHGVTNKLIITEYRTISESIQLVNKRIDNTELPVADNDSKLAIIDADTPFRVIKESAGLTSAFETWGFIGDSMASGEIWGWNNRIKTFTATQVNKKITADGTIVDADGYCISSVMHETGYKPKAVVEFASNEGLSNTMCVIAKTDSAGNITEVRTLGGTSVKYTNSLPESPYIVVCYPTNNVPLVRFVSSYHEDNYNISWGQYLCRLCGSEGVNYSIGGGTAKKFVLSEAPFDSTNGLSKLLSDEQKQGYIIGFGVNDRNNAMYSGGNVTDISDIGADINLSNPSLNADTFAGWYGKIIQSIKAQNEDSILFLVTVPEAGDTYNDINTIIRAMPTIFESYGYTIFVLDLKEYCPINTWYQSHFKLNGLHLNAQGYQYVAYQLCTYIDWLMQKYSSYFKGISLIGKAILNDPT